MNLSYQILSQIKQEYGESFYLLDTDQFIRNYQNLLGSFKKYYSNTHIAYSYKTNYIPKLCKTVNELGGYAEVVSDMELNIALKIGVIKENIYFNGPYKNPEAVKDLLLNGGKVNIDSLEEFILIKELSNNYPNKTINIGIRCNFDIYDNVISRFGIDTQSVEFQELLTEIKNYKNINLNGLHFHFAARALKGWENRIIGLGKLINDYFIDYDFEYISLGGGLYGNMADSLKVQFSDPIPSYEDYASVVANGFNNLFKNKDNKPMLIIEPGSALAGDVMKFAAPVKSIKNVRGKDIATLLGSIYNINPTLNKKNPPIEIFNRNNNPKAYTNLDFGGFTCIESDYLYRGYDGSLSVGDYVVFGNVGSYSVVLKPPFILPNFPIVEYDGVNQKILLIKKGETFDDVFHTYVF